MENFACAIENMLQEKLLLYQELKKIFEQEKKYIVDMNVDSLWETLERKKQLALEILGIRERIFSLFEEKKLSLNMQASAFSLSQVINSLPLPVKTKSGLKKVKVKLETLKKEITALASENKRYTNEYLSVIDGIFATIIGTENKKAYNNTGKVFTDNSVKTLLRVEV